MWRDKERPQRPFKNLAEFKFKRYEWRLTKKQLMDTLYWPCIYCDGRGEVHKSEDRDAYEGYKLAPWYKCLPCSGTGQGTKEQCKAVYDREIAEFKKNLKQWKEINKLRNSALRKLTAMEKKVLEL